MTIRDVAQAAGVSISTVSRVLNGQEGQMTERTRRRVQAAIQKLNYLPNRLASSLKNDRSETLGVVVPNILNPFFTAVVRSIQDYISSRGYDILISNTDDSPEREAHSIRALFARRVDALIIAKCGEDLPLFERLSAEHYPLVMIDRQIPGLSCDSVVVDNVGVCEKVVNRLLELGHRRVGVISPPRDHIEPRIDRIDGCRRAMRANGRELTPDFLVEPDFHKDSGREATAKLLLLNPPPTALFVLNTFLAMGVLKELEARNLKLPKDLSFVMFDDPEWSELLTPKISAVRQPIHEIGQAAARLALERIERPEKPFEKICLEAKFIERESNGVCK